MHEHVNGGCRLNDSYESVIEKPSDNPPVSLDNNHSSQTVDDCSDVNTIQPEIIEISNSKFSSTSQDTTLKRREPNGLQNSPEESRVACTADGSETQDTDDNGNSDLPRLPFSQRIGYSLGHVLNDLCAAMWFSYLLVYMQNIQQLNSKLAGYAMLLGQVADALFTPFLGYESDRTTGCRSKGVGNRKTWHIVGTVCVMVSFPFIFSNCPGCSRSEGWAKLIYYAPFIVIFQFGWASTQISHLALMPELTNQKAERVELTASRNIFTVISSLMVYGIAWFLLSRHSDTETLTKEDMSRFMTLALLVTGIGAVFVVAFYVITKEPVKNDTIKKDPKCGDKQNNNNSADTEPVTNGAPNGLHPRKHEHQKQKTIHGRVTWKNWLKEVQFYQVAILYTCTRLAVNLSQIYMALFLLHTLKLRKTFIAIIPLVVYVTGFVASLVMKPVNNHLGRKFTYIVGSGMILLASVLFWISKAYHRYAVFAPASVLGAGTSTILVVSLATTSDLIGSNTESGAFVFGCMSFADKLANGLAVILIQYLHPCANETECCTACENFYHYTLVFGPSLSVVGGLLALASLSRVKIGNLRCQKEIIKVPDSVINTTAEAGDVHSEIKDKNGHQKEQTRSIQVMINGGFDTHC